MSDHSDLPLVSVIIPVKNGKKYIHECIDSVLAQNYPALDIIVVDDGSDDYDYRLLSELDPRIRVFRRPGEGVSKARNFAMQEAHGEFFAFLDADDVWFPGKIQAQVRYFRAHPEVAVVFGGFVRWEGDVAGHFPAAKQLVTDCSGLQLCDPARSGKIYTRLLLGLLVGMNTAIITRSIYLSCGGFDESMRIGEDHDYWLRLARIAEMHCLAGSVALYRIHSGSAMRNLDATNHLARLLLLSRERWGLENGDGISLSERAFEQRLAAVHFNHGYSHFWRGNPEVALHSFSLAYGGGFRRARCSAYIALCSIKIGEQRALKTVSRALSPLLANGMERADCLPLPALTTPWWSRFLTATLRTASGGSGATLTIFTFHKVPRIIDEYATDGLTLRDFTSLLTILLQNFNILSLAEGVRRLDLNDLPKFSAVLSFDDGYPDWIDGILPLLEKDRIPATFFISTCQFEGKPLWFERVYRIQNRLELGHGSITESLREFEIAVPADVVGERKQLLEKIKYLPINRRDRLIDACEAELGLTPEARLFTTAHVRQLRAAGFDIGAHSNNHPVLATCSDSEARDEIFGSKATLEEILREPVTQFSYPNGVPGIDIRPQHIDLVRRAGFDLAVTTAMGVATATTPRFQLPRFDTWARSTPRLMLHYLMIQNKAVPLIAQPLGQE